MKRPLEDATTTKAPLLDRDAYFQRAKAARLRTNPEGQLIHAMYSSLVDGIVTDPELMVVPLDDHAFIRGHAVFDTATLTNGRVYRLGIHLDRLFLSARNAQLKLPFGNNEEENRARMTSIVCQLCVASGCRDGSIRYFLGAGPGNFGFTSAGCEPSFYCVIYGAVPGMLDVDAIAEVTVRGDRVPMKPPLLASLKSNNYMLNCMTAMDAQSRGGKFGIQVREDDTIAEGAVVNVVVVTKDRVLLTPSFGDILAGTTVQKTMELARRDLVGEDRLLKEVRQEVIPLATAMDAAELFFVAGDTHVRAIKSLDGKQIGDGKMGPVAKETLRLLLADSLSDTDEHIELQYD